MPSGDSLYEKKQDWIDHEATHKDHTEDITRIGCALCGATENCPNHLASHLERITLFSIPRYVFGDSEVDSDGSNEPQGWSHGSFGSSISGPSIASAFSEGIVHEDWVHKGGEVEDTGLSEASPEQGWETKDAATYHKIIEYERSNWTDSKLTFAERLDKSQWEAERSAFSRN